MEEPLRTLGLVQKKVSTEVLPCWLGTEDKWGGIFTVHKVIKTSLTLERDRKQRHGILILSNKCIYFFLCKVRMS